jgi:hypothetical protein
MKARTATNSKEYFYNTRRVTLTRLPRLSNNELDDAEVGSCLTLPTSVVLEVGASR